jgi:hypothetical protein
MKRLFRLLLVLAAAVLFVWSLHHAALTIHLLHSDAAEIREIALAQLATELFVLAATGVVLAAYGRRFAVSR